MQEVTRCHRSTVFALMCEDKTNLLSLYNGVNKSNYGNPEELAVTTLENAVYMKMKNDASVVVDHRLNLYEHQSTVNPNLPLRDLHYVSEVLKNLVPTREMYRSTRISIPEPKFFCFYNGRQKMPERVEYRLSELFEQKSGTPQIELVVNVLNINKGYNEELVQGCEMLNGYCQFVERVRENMVTMPVREAVALSVEWCIARGFQSDFFRAHRSEVVEMSYFDFDEEGYKEILQEEAYANGFNSGMADGMAQGMADGMAQGKADGMAQGMAQCILELLKEFGEVPELLKEAICSESDTQRLLMWHNLAAKTSGFDDFKKHMQD